MIKQKSSRMQERLGFGHWIFKNYMFCKQFEKRVKKASLLHGSVEFPHKKPLILLSKSRPGCKNAWFFGIDFSKTIFFASKRDAAKI